MTVKPTPTNAELEALLLAKLPASKHYIRPVIEKMVAAMQAAIDKWGTPAPVGVGEVAERYRNAIASACEGWTMPDGLRKHLETALWSPPTPQPTPTTHPADSVQEDAARLDWLLLHISGAEFRRIGVHYSGNASRADVDAARKQGASQ